MRWKKGYKMIGGKSQKKGKEEEDIVFCPIMPKVLKSVKSAQRK